METKNKKNIFSGKTGFTLLEILLVIGIIAVLAAVIVVSLDPARRFEEARNSRRLSDIQSILSAVQQYTVDNNGTLPDGISDVETQIGAANVNCATTISSSTVCNVTTQSCVDFSVVDTGLVRYLKSIPFDPLNGDADYTHYSVQVDANGIVTVRACDSTDASISAVSR
jgi:prepilin-type N-terminal cleavage/methylation domain-containing protein